MSCEDRNWARIALRCLDLTRLGDDDDTAAVTSQLNRAQTSHGTVVAVCLWPRFVSLARAHLGGTPVRIAAVANFPTGREPADQVSRTIKGAIANGADEIDTVLPWEAYLAGDAETAERSVRTAREATGDRTLKVILETGALKQPYIIREAARHCLEWGADFLKTSTGKGHPGASAEAVREMLAALQEWPDTSCGLKVSGGIRTLADARVFLELAAEAMGESWLEPATFRLGASALLDDIEHALEDKSAKSGDQR